MCERNGTGGSHSPEARYGLHATAAGCAGHTAACSQAPFATGFGVWVHRGSDTAEAGAQGQLPGTADDSGSGLPYKVYFLDSYSEFSLSPLRQN